jgi:hypothetical protein
VNATRALERTRDFFAVKRAGELPEEARAAVAHDLALARQKHDAARILLRNGARAESLSVALQAFALSKKAAEQVPAHERTAKLVAAADRSLAARAVPDLEEGFVAADEETLDAVLAAVSALDSDLSDATLAPSARPRVRATRIGATVLAILAALYTVRWAAKRPPHLTVEASSSYSSNFLPQRVVDEEPATEWLLPDHTLGWLDVSPLQPTKLKRIKLLNSRNSPGPDRAIGEFKLEVFAGGRVVKTIEDAFPPFNKLPQWKTIELGVVEPIDKIRISVKTWQGDGAGLAELSVE